MHKQETTDLQTFNGWGQHTMIVGSVHVGPSRPAEKEKEAQRREKEKIVLRWLAHTKENRRRCVVVVTNLSHGA